MKKYLITAIVDDDELSSLDAIASAVLNERFKEQFVSKTDMNLFIDLYRKIDAEETPI